MTSSPLVDVMTSNSGETIGYSCRNLVEKNKVSQVDFTFYIDLIFPDATSTAAEAIEYVRVNLVRSVAEGYGISNGIRCANPPIDGSTWLVEVKSEPDQYSQVKDEVWNKCRKLDTQDGESCFVFEGVVSSLVVGDNDAPDADEYIQALLDDPNSKLMNGSPYRVAFIGRPTIDPTGQDEIGRDQLEPPISPQDIKYEDTNSKDSKKTVTIVGGLLVAAFCLALLGIIYVLFRRRRAYLREREAHSALLKSSMRNFHHAGTESQSQDGNIKSLTQPTPSDDFVDGVDELDDGKDPENFPNNITFDLGNSFKDQLMGVHSRSSAPIKSSMPMPPLGSNSMPDNTSDSDADSWAQTDGTIGSLELQLEPITAEV